MPARFSTRAAGLSAVAVVALLAGAACGPSTTRLVTVPDVETRIPAKLMAFASDRWKGAHVASAVTGNPACAGAPAAPVVTGDFNGDGLADFVARLTSDSGPHLVVAFARVRSYDARDVTGAVPTVDGALSVRPRGTTYHIDGSALDFYFGADTLVVTPCGGKSTAYVWNGSGFDPATLAGDTP